MKTTLSFVAFAAIVLSGCATGSLAPTMLSTPAGTALPAARAASGRRIGAKGYRVLYSFRGAPDGAQPQAGLLPANGLLIGTTYAGGASSGCGSSGCGTAFSVRTSGEEVVLHDFSGGADGANPVGGVTGLGGTFYGTTVGGGSGGYGTVFSLTPQGKETVIYPFTGIPDGAQPEATMTVWNGVLYGTTFGGGIGGCFGNPKGCGTAFSVTTTGSETVLHRFGVRPDGALPTASLTMVRATFYGTTSTRVTNEGGGLCGAGVGCGVVFKMTPTGNENVVYRFLAPPDGSNPAAGVTKFNGLFYGTTPYGGAFGKGTVYLANGIGGEQVVHSFKGFGDGANPIAGLTAFGGLAYGTTYSGGRYGKGTVFTVDPSGTKTVVHDFAGGRDGANPRGRLAVLGTTLYGTTQFGGTNNAGTVYQLTP